MIQDILLIILQVGLGAILTVISFILSNALKEFRKISNDIKVVSNNIADIKSSVLLVAARHEELEKRVTKIELKVYN